MTDDISVGETADWTPEKNKTKHARVPPQIIPLREAKSEAFPKHSRPGWGVGHRPAIPCKAGSGYETDRESAAAHVHRRDNEQPHVNTGGEQLAPDVLKHKRDRKSTAQTVDAMLAAILLCFNACAPTPLTTAAGGVAPRIPALPSGDLQDWDAERSKWTDICGCQQPDPRLPVSRRARPSPASRGLQILAPRSRAAAVMASVVLELRRCA